MARIRCILQRKFIKCLIAFVFVTFCAWMNNWTFPLAIEIHTRVAYYSRTDCSQSGLESIPNHGRSVQDGAWFRVEGQHQWTNQIFSYSAFYDERRSLGTLPVIRVISVTDLRETDDIKCLVWYEKGAAFVTVPVERHASGAGAVVKNKLYKEYMITCKLADEKLPRYVSVVPDTPGNKSLYKIPVELPQFHKNKLDLGLCLSLTYWHHDPYRIIEWIEIQRLVGVNKIVVYNNSMSEESSRVFLYYQIHYPGFLEIRQSWNFIPDDGELILHLQMSPVINDCMYRNMYYFKKILVVDLDEMIVPYKFQKIPMLLEYMEALIHPKHPARNFAFRNAYFFFDFPKANDSVRNMITSTYVNRASVSEMGYSSKSVVDPLSCIIMHNHYCWAFTALYSGGNIMVEVAPGFGVNRHYKKCHLSNCDELLKNWQGDFRMLDFRKPLIKAMNRNLINLNMELVEDKT